MLGRLAWRAMRQRRGRLALALAALTVAATLSTTLLALYADIERKLREQFRGYGANLVIVPGGDRQTLPPAALAEADKQGDAALLVYAVESISGEPVVTAGADFERLAPLTGYWQVEGARRPRAGECLVGARVAERFRLRVGSEIELGKTTRRVAGIVTTGGPEDSQVLVDPVELGPPEASRIVVRAEGSRVEQARAELARALPEADVRLLRALVETEAGVVLKIRGTLWLLTALVLAIAALCVMNNFWAIVHQRRKEIGVLKAIGGTEGRIAALFGVEVLVVGALGSLTGFGLGQLAAGWLGREIFQQAIPPRIEALPAVAALTLLVALAGTALPLLRIRRIEAAAILRGE